MISIIVSTRAYPVVRVRCRYYAVCYPMNALAGRRVVVFTISSGHRVRVSYLPHFTPDSATQLLVAARSKLVFNAVAAQVVCLFPSSSGSFRLPGLRWRGFLFDPLCRLHSSTHFAATSCRCRSLPVCTLVTPCAFTNFGDFGWRPPRLSVPCLIGIAASLFRPIRIPCLLVLSLLSRSRRVLRLGARRAARAAARPCHKAKVFTRLLFAWTFAFSI